MRTFDTVGGETTASRLGTIRDGGTLVTIAGAPPEENANARGIRAELLVSSPNADQLAQIAELVSDGDLRIEIAEVIRHLAVRDHGRGLSSGERQLYAQAKRLLASEVQYARATDEDEALVWIEGVLDSVPYEQVAEAAHLE